MESVRRTLAGRYQLGVVIGRGGMGTVYRGIDLVLRRPVAVKLISDTPAAQDPASVARLQREAKAAAALSHPSVVMVYDADLDEGTPFIVMELLAGQDLAAVLRERAPLAPDEAVPIAAQIASALAAAHGAGMIHRDIKPANVMLTAEHSVKVLDFGLARARDATTLITQPARAAGTAAYMAPELAMGNDADERSDIYSLGCLLYAMLAGAPPFTGQADAAILHQHVNARPRPLRDLNPQLDRELADMVGEMLAKDPEARPQRARDLAERLEQLPLAASAPTATAATRTLLHDPPAALPTAVYLRGRARGRRVVAAAMLAAVFAATLIALSFIGAPHASRASASRHRGSSTAPAGGGSSGASETARASHPNASSQTEAQTVSPAQEAIQSGTPADQPGHQGAGGSPHEEDGQKPVGAEAESHGPSKPQQQEKPPHGHHGQPHGHVGQPPGHGGTPPGHGGTPPGQD